ncbi:DUF4351 domain-containing protein [Thermanaeromonas sp.]|uniref:DUF4351 domain-containing protein n=1 Tax=Thermanaeromonas sp. TaxID=2003697 RepID=UPI0034255231
MLYAPALLPIAQTLYIKGPRLNRLLRTHLLIPEGLEEGRRERAQDLIMRQLKKRLGFLSSEVEERIRCLSMEELDELAEKIFEVSRESDLRKFLSAK